MAWWNSRLSCFFPLMSYHSKLSRSCVHLEIICRLKFMPPCSNRCSAKRHFKCAFRKNNADWRWVWVDIVCGVEDDEFTSAARVCYEELECWHWPEWCATPRLNAAWNLWDYLILSPIDSLWSPVHINTYAFFLSFYNVLAFSLLSQWLWYHFRDLYYTSTAFQKKIFIQTIELSVFFQRNSMTKSQAIMSDNKQITNWRHRINMNSNRHGHYTSIFVHPDHLHVLYKLLVHPVENQNTIWMWYWKFYDISIDL